jgi:hypothetical protein
MLLFKCIGLDGNQDLDKRVQSLRDHNTGQSGKGIGDRVGKRLSTPPRSLVILSIVLVQSFRVSSAVRVS